MSLCSESVGLWNAIQALWEKVCEEEKQFVEKHKKRNIHGEREVPVWLEEADGSYANPQDKVRNKVKKEIDSFVTVFREILDMVSLYFLCQNISIRR